MSIGGINDTVSMHVLHTVNVYKPQLFPSDTDVLIGHQMQKASHLCYGANVFKSVWLAFN